MKLSSSVVLLMVLSNACAAALAEPVQVDVKSLGENTSFISLETDVKASQKSLWDLLVDFNHHAGFLPYITKSQVIGREGPDLVVDQAGAIRILFWSYSMRMKQRVTEEPQVHMHFRTVEGDFSRLEGDFNLSVSTGTALATHLECQFTVKPKRRVPDWAVRVAAKRYLRRMVNVLSEKAEGLTP